MKMIKRLLLAVALLSGVQSLAEQKPENLLQSQKRPTVEEIENVLGQNIAINPFQLQDYNALGASLLNSYKNDLPRIIAQLEKAYPGAIFLGLGRDSALMVDALDAFYRAQGQTGRAKLVEASGNSFTGNVTNEMLVKFLENYGLDLDHLENSRPIIMFDGTRFNETSQSRRLTRAIYQIAAAKGIEPAKLIRKINFVSTCFNGYRYYPKNLISTTDTEAYFAAQEKIASAQGPTEILSVDGWFLTHGYNWTDTYGPFQYDANKNVMSTLGRPMTVAEKTYVLGNQVYVMQIAKSEELKASVAQEAKNLGYDLDENLKKYTVVKALNNVVPAQKEAVVKAKPVDEDKNLKISIQQNLKNLQALGNDYEYEKVKLPNDKVKLTENGNRVLQVLGTAENITAPHFLEISFDALSSLYKQEKLGTRDFRRIFIYLISLKKIEDTAFIKQVNNQRHSLLPVDIMLGREREREKYLEMNGIALENYKLLTNNGMAPLSCRFSYSN